MPPEIPEPGSGEIVGEWSSTLQLKDLGSSKLGCKNADSDATNRCGSAMSNNQIVIKRPPNFWITATINEISRFADGNNSNLKFSITSNNIPELAKYHLFDGSAMFAIHPQITYGSYTWNGVAHFTPTWKQGDTITLELVKKATPTPFTGTPPTLSFLSVSPSTITEGNSATIRVNLAQAAPTGGVNVCITSEPRIGNDLTNTFATHDTDYDLPTTITVPAGQRSATGTLTTVDDSTPEKNEILHVVPCSIPDEAYPVSGADLYQVGSVKVTIRDND